MYIILNIYILSIPKTPLLSDASRTAIFGRGWSALHAYATEMYVSGDAPPTFNLNFTAAQRVFRVTVFHQGPANSYNRWEE